MKQVSITPQPIYESHFLYSKSRNELGNRVFMLPFFRYLDSIIYKVFGSILTKLPLVTLCSSTHTFPRYLYYLNWKHFAFRQQSPMTGKRNSSSQAVRLIWGCFLLECRNILQIITVMTSWYIEQCLTRFNSFLCHFNRRGNLVICKKLLHYKLRVYNENVLDWQFWPGARRGLICFEFF